MAREIIMFLVLLLSSLRLAWGPQHKSAVKPASYHAAELSPAESEYPLAKGKKVTIDLSNGGAIDITGWDKETVSVTAMPDEDGCMPQIDQSASGVNISEDCDHEWRHHHSRTPALKLIVPREVNLDLSTGGGEISLSNIQGNIEGETMGGDLELTELRGRIDLKTMGGDITLKDSQLDGKLETMGGEVLFEDVVGDVKGSSMGGQVRYKNVRQSVKDAPDHEVRITTMGGEINVDRAPVGADLHTMGGDIHVGPAGDHVRCETMGGNIVLDSVDGSIHATTMGGDVSAKMVGDPNKGQRDVMIDSKGGDIELIVPAALSMTFDVQLALTKNSDREVSIHSDFPMQQRETPNWESREGTPRKYIYGTGKVGDGKNKITLRTINGNINIKKG